MPHLHYALNRPLSGDDREHLLAWTMRTFADVMETGTDHVAVSIDEYPARALSIGRAAVGAPVAVLDADVRDGRSFGQRERFADAVMDRLAEDLEIPRAHCYVVYTEHPGQDFFLHEGALDSWTTDEDDEGAMASWRVAEEDAGALE